MTSECDNLDAFLADDLPAGAAAQFAQHLAQCELCHEAVEQQRWIDGLLRSNEHSSLEPVSPALLHAFHTSITRRRQAASLVACGLAAAATIAFVAVGWTLKLNRQADGSRHPTTDHFAAHIDLVNPESVNAAQPRATFVSNGDTIAVPLESADDDVTVVQLYPTTQAERRIRSELVLESLYSETNGG